jgi:uncharacterized protein YeeX (DUF496 family)
MITATKVKAKSNRIRGTGAIEQRVMEWLEKGMSCAVVSEKLAREHGFVASEKTVNNYKNTFFDDSTNEAVQALRNAVAVSVGLDRKKASKYAQDFSGYIEKLVRDNEFYEKCVAQANKRLSEIDDLRELAESGKSLDEDVEKIISTLTQEEKSLQDRIADYKTKIAINLKIVSEKMDGDQGTVMENTRKKVAVVDVYYQTTINKFPKTQEEFDKLTFEGLQKLIKTAKEDFRLKLLRL